MVLPTGARQHLFRVAGQKRTLFRAAWCDRPSLAFCRISLRKGCTGGRLVAARTEARGAASASAGRPVPVAQMFVT